MAHGSAFVNTNYRWFAVYKGINFYELMIDGKPSGVYAIALGFALVPSESLDDLRYQVDDWWKLRRN